KSTPLGAARLDDAIPPDLEALGPAQALADARIGDLRPVLVADARVDVVGTRDREVHQLAVAGLGERALGHGREVTEVGADAQLRQRLEIARGGPRRVEQPGA